MLLLSMTPDDDRTDFAETTEEAISAFVGTLLVVGSVFGAAFLIAYYAGKGEQKPEYDYSKARGALCKMRGAYTWVLRTDPVY